MGILANLFKKEKQEQTKTYTEFKELGTYRSYFSVFGKDIYKSDDVRTCIRALAEHTSKANPRCTDKRIERILQLRPNRFMNGKDFLASSEITPTRLSVSIRCHSRRMKLLSIKTDYTSSSILMEITQIWWFLGMIWQCSVKIMCSAR